MALQGPLVVKGVMLSNAYVQFLTFSTFPPHKIKGNGCVYFNKEQAEIGMANVLESMTVICDYVDGVDEASMLDIGALSDQRFASMTVVDSIDTTPSDNHLYVIKKLKAPTGTGFA